jgi:hypothetical protein
MTSKEFIIWLQGFLDASDDLTVEGVEFIKSKMKDVSDPYIPSPGDIISPMPPFNQPYTINYTVDCPLGGYHEYPDIWHSIIPPPCKKCGQSQPMQTIYCHSTGNSCQLLDLTKSDSTTSIPQPQMTADDYAFSTNGENIKIISDAIEKCWKNPPEWDEAKDQAIREGQQLMCEKLTQEYEKVPKMGEYVEFEIKKEYRDKFGEKNYIRFEDTPQNREIYKDIIVDSSKITEKEGQESYVEKIRGLIINAEENFKKRKAMETNFNLHRDESSRQILEKVMEDRNKQFRDSPLYKSMVEETRIKPIKPDLS